MQVFFFPLTLFIYLSPQEDYPFNYWDLFCGMQKQLLEELLQESTMWTSSVASPECTSETLTVFFRSPNSMG